jgi:hypothetical protein
MPDRGSELVALDDALNTPAQFDARKAKVVEMLLRRSQRRRNRRGIEDFNPERLARLEIGASLVDARDEEIRPARRASSRRLGHI